LRGEEVDRPPNFDIMMTFRRISSGNRFPVITSMPGAVPGHRAVLEAFHLDIVQPFRSLPEAADLAWVEFHPMACRSAKLPC
jgi:hypothetical protein